MRFPVRTWRLLAAILVGWLFAVGVGLAVLRSRSGARHPQGRPTPLGVWRPALRQGGHLTAAGVAWKSVEEGISGITLTPDPDAEVTAAVRHCHKGKVWPRPRCYWNWTRTCAADGPHVPLAHLYARHNTHLINKVFMVKNSRANYLPNASDRQWRTIMGWFVRKREGLPPAAFYEMVQKMADRTPGMQVVSVEGSALPETLNAIPVTDSHGGQHSLWEAWPVEHTGLETVHWDVKWTEDLSAASGQPQLTPAQPPMWAALIPNAWVYGGTVFTCNDVLGAGGCLWELTAPVGAPNYVEKAVVMCDGNCQGYFHFTHEHLPRLAVLHDTIMSDPEVKVVIPSMNWLPGFTPRFIRSYVVDVLGIPEEQVISNFTALHTPPSRVWEAPAYFARWAYYPQPSLCGNHWTQQLLLLRKVAFQHLDLASVRARHRRGRDVFTVLLAERSSTEQTFARKNVSSRMPANWAELRERLHSHYEGTDVRFSSTLAAFGTAKHRTVVGQVKLFHEADMVIGPHGANLANIMWMRHGTTVLEFMSHRYGNMCYYVTASRLGLQHRFVLHSGKKNTEQTPYEIAFTELQNHIDDAVARAAGEEPLRFS